MDLLGLTKSIVTHVINCCVWVWLGSGVVPRLFRNTECWQIFKPVGGEDVEDVEHGLPEGELILAPKLSFVSDPRKTVETGLARQRLPVVHHVLHVHEVHEATGPGHSEHPPIVRYHSLTIQGHWPAVLKISRAA